MIVKEYLEELRKTPNRLGSVKNICEGLIDEKMPTTSYWNEKSVTDVLRWIDSCIERTKADITSREEWKDLPNMQNIIDYGYREIEALQKLQALLR